jgi:C4-dicarboxylate-binding protein DctP
MVIIFMLVAGCTTTPTAATSPAATTAVPPNAKPSAASTSKDSASSFPVLKQKITINLATSTKETDPMTIVARMIETYLEKNSNAQVQVDVFSNGQMLSDAGMVEGVPSGLADLAVTSFSQWSGVVPEMSSLALCGVWPDEKTYWATREGGLDDYLAKVVETKTKCKLIGWIHVSSNSAFSCTKKELRVPKDFAGLKFRAPNKSLAEMVGALGGAGVVISSADVYTSLQTGVIDGTFSNVNSWKERQYADVAKYLTRVPLGYSDSWGIVTSLDNWNKWPKELQDLLLQVSKDARTWSISYGNEQEEKIYTEAKNNSKLQVYEVPAGDVPLYTKLIAPGQLATLQKSVGDKSYGEIMAILNKYIKQ